MPLYDYRCPKCRTVSEIRHGAGERYEGGCPACGATPLQRVYGAAPIHFKGSGFYVTDSKAKKSEPAKPDAKPAEKTSEPSTTAEKPASTETKTSTETDKGAKKKSGGESAA